MRKKTRRHRKMILIYIFSVIMLLVFSVIRTEKLLKPVVSEQAEHFSEKIAAEIIERTVSGYLRDNQYRYSDFAAVLYNEEKLAASVETIPYTINKVQSELTLLINQRLKGTDKVKTEIPIGTLTQTYVFNGKGPKIHIKISPLGSADVKIKSELESSGINQTKHHISAVISVNVTSSTPLYKFNTHTEFEFLIAETVIIGDVPDISPISGLK